MDLYWCPLCGAFVLHKPGGDVIREAVQNEQAQVPQEFLTAFAGSSEESGRRFVRDAGGH